MTTTQTYIRKKSWHRTQFRVCGHANAVRQFSKFIQGLPHKHEILIDVCVLCGSKMYPVGGSPLREIHSRAGESEHSTLRVHSN